MLLLVLGLVSVLAWRQELVRRTVYSSRLRVCYKPDHESSEVHRGAAGTSDLTIVPVPHICTPDTT